MNSRDKLFFTTNLMNWNSNSNGRKMPWKGEKNPYKIWLSEVILQQTRVEQGWNYYNNFIEKYPSIYDLAVAPDTEVFKLWEGLGYYSRCRNLLATARYIVNELQGKFPGEYKSIIQLKGIGPYTAAAIASFAYKLPYAVLDGNVYRLLSRYFGIGIPVDSREGKDTFTKLSTILLDKTSPGIYNQAIMDLGATICKPQPFCLSCPLQVKCVAYKTGTIYKYPVKQKKPERKVRWFYYIIAAYKESLLIRKREKDIWQGLHELVLIESTEELSEEQIFQNVVFKELGAHRLVDISPALQQHLTHQTIKGKFIYIRLLKKPGITGYTLESNSAILKLAFPKFINSYFAESRILY